jgi:hypothetical protein
VASHIARAKAAAAEGVPRTPDNTQSVAVNADTTLSAHSGGIPLASRLLSLDCTAAPSTWSSSVIDNRIRSGGQVGARNMVSSMVKATGSLWYTERATSLKACGVG